MRFSIDLPFVIVEWLDAWKDATNDASLTEARAAHHTVRCFNAGWLLFDDEEGVQIAAEVSPTESLPYRQRSLIPRAMVVAVHPIKLTGPKKPKPKEDGSNDIPMAISNPLV